MTIRSVTSTSQNELCLSDHNNTEQVLIQNDTFYVTLVYAVRRNMLNNYSHLSHIAIPAHHLVEEAMERMPPAEQLTR